MNDEILGEPASDDPRGYADENIGIRHLTPHLPTQREKLLELKAKYEGKLQDVNAAIAALDKNPEVETTLDLLQKALRRS
jgi:hypothetical protein